MKGVNSILKSIKGLYDKLCCILANTATTNNILAAAATEATQLNVLAAVDMMRDYETRLVVDGAEITWLEVRYWDVQNGTLGAPQYYPPGGTVAGSPDLTGLGLRYINPNTFLSSIVSNTGGILTDTNTLSTPDTLVGTEFYRVTGAGAASVPAGKRRVTFYNASKPVATVNGSTLRRGEVITFVADGVRDTLNAISYDALTTELVISTVG